MTTPILSISANSLALVQVLPPNAVSGSSPKAVYTDQSSTEGLPTEDSSPEGPPPNDSSPENSSPEGPSP
jgi:hypothetical protein